MFGSDVIGGIKGAHMFKTYFFKIFNIKDIFNLSILNYKIRMGFINFDICYLFYSNWILILLYFEMGIAKSICNSIRFEFQINPFNSKLFKILSYKYLPLLSFHHFSIF